MCLTLDSTVSIDVLDIVTYTIIFHQSSFVPIGLGDGYTPVTYFSPIVVILIDNPVVIVLLTSVNFVVERFILSTIQKPLLPKRAGSVLAHFATITLRLYLLVYLGFT